MSEKQAYAPRLRKGEEFKPHLIYKGRMWNIYRRRSDVKIAIPIACSSTRWGAYRMATAHLLANGELG